jgi:hypothetical protein
MFGNPPVTTRSTILNRQLKSQNSINDNALIYINLMLIYIYTCTLILSLHVLSAHFFLSAPAFTARTRIYSH